MCYQFYAYVEIKYWLWMKLWYSDAVTHIYNNIYLNGKFSIIKRILTWIHEYCSCCKFYCVSLLVTLYYLLLFLCFSVSMFVTLQSYAWYVCTTKCKKFFSTLFATCLHVTHFDMRCSYISMWHCIMQFCIWSL